jgi:trimeric autotransporter adhesin
MVLMANTSGSYNTANGYALESNTTGANNTANGYEALFLNSTGTVIQLMVFTL